MVAWLLPFLLFSEGERLGLAEQLGVFVSRLVLAFTRRFPRTHRAALYWGCFCWVPLLLHAGTVAPVTAFSLAYAKNYPHALSFAAAAVGLLYFVGILVRIVLSSATDGKFGG